MRETDLNHLCGQHSDIVAMLPHTGLRLKSYSPNFCHFLFHFFEEGPELEGKGVGVVYVLTGKMGFHALEKKQKMEVD